MRSTNARTIWTLMLAAWLVSTLPTTAQNVPLVMTSARAKSADTAVHKSAPSAPDQAEATAANVVAANVNVLPLFGERSKTPEQIDREIRFLSECDQNFATRQEASRFFAERGWDYLSEGQLDTAAYRFNLAYLLNNRNTDAFWGLGVICYQKDQLTDAVRMLKRGLATADTNTVLMTDLATVQIKHFQQKQNVVDLDEAETVLHDAIALSPNNATAFLKLSLVSFCRADYPKAWEHLHKVRALDVSIIDFVYLNELMTKLPDPKGVFK